MGVAGVGRASVGDMAAPDAPTASTDGPSRRRAYVFPEPGDTLATIAARVLPGQAADLLPWNLHLITRRSLSAEPTTSKNPTLLCTDVVYTEPPIP